MATAKKTTAKKATVSKTAKTKRVPVQSIVLDDNVVWVVLERKFFSLAVHSTWATRDQAQKMADELDEASGMSFNKYTVQRSALFGTK